ncbi:MAG: nucleotide pyrophosphohydrolase [Bacilli bacterium]|nr:nucleotide pyrophosphohydrolase [Bacilli bacterium]
MKPETINRIRAFTTDRDWDKYHTPNNLAKTIVLEANELLECFQWDDENFKIEKVKEELADVIVNCQNLLDKLGLDVDEIIDAKMAQNEKKYPVEKIKGIAKKYNEI